MFLEKKYIKTLQIVVKTVERCNISCTYCYYFEGENATYTNMPPYIKSETIEKLADFISEGCKQYTIDRVVICFHGGEPLMQKQKDFDSMCALLKNAITPYSHLSLVIQTNGMLITEGWLKLFSKYNVKVGVSLDGVKEDHDKYRLDKKGEGTYDRVVKGIEKYHKARKNGMPLLELSALSVANPASDGAKVYRHFIDDLNIKQLNFLLPDQDYNTIKKDSYSLTDYSRYMISVFKEWVKDGNPDIEISYITGVIQPIVNAIHIKSNIITTSKIDPSSLIFVVNSDGSINIDDSLVTNSGYHEVNIGLNIRTSTFDQFVKSKELQHYLHEVIYKIPDDCIGCDWLKVCGGGSKASHRYSNDNKYNNPSVYCEPLQDYFAEVVESLVAHGASPNDVKRALLS